MRNTKVLTMLPGLLTAFALCMPVAAQTGGAAGQKRKIAGFIVSCGTERLVIRDTNGSDVAVGITSATKISMKKTNMFGTSATLPITTLLRGLVVEISTRSDNSGQLVAEKIKFTETDLDIARSLDTRVGPVETQVNNHEGRLDTAEQRLADAEVNALRLSVQIDELVWVANTARGGAKSAQDTADHALATAKANSAEIQATNNRISDIDNYEARQNIAMSFKVNSAVLTDVAKAFLNIVAARAKIEKGYLIQVTGYTSAEGTKSTNRTLSERRADAVKRYLAENQDIPLFRIITPFGYGEAKPVANNSTLEGRKQNRRVMVTILVSKGLTTTDATTSNVSSEAVPEGSK